LEVSSEIRDSAGGDMAGRRHSSVSDDSAPMHRRPRQTMAAMLAVALSCCGGGQERVEGYPGAVLEARSPSGHAVASVVETDTDPGSITQVFLAFDRCGVGPVSLRGVGLGLDLAWRNDTILEVRHPPGIVLLGSPPDQRYECGGDPVRVVMVPL
jgi:hypothetical protein